MAKRSIFTEEIPSLGAPPKYNFDISPSYQRLKGAGEQTLGEAEESGMFGMGWKALMVPILMGIKVLDTPRILTVNTLGNIFEGGFEFMFNLFDGRPGDAFRSLASNAAEVFTDTGKDIFTLDLETTRDRKSVV